MPCRKKSPRNPGCPARGRWGSASTSPCASRRRRTCRNRQAPSASSSGMARPARSSGWTRRTTSPRCCSLKCGLSTRSICTRRSATPCTATTRSRSRTDMKRAVTLLVAAAAAFGPAVAAQAADPGVVEQHGQLRVQGNRIVDQAGAPVQLRGMSLFWSQWIPKYYTAKTVKWLRDDWKITVVRAAMAAERGGYESNPEAERDKVIAVVDAAIELGIYVVIDYHAHTAQKDLPRARAFFADMARRYGDKPNVLYEPFRSEEHTSELQSRRDLVCRLLLEKK